MRTQDIIVGAIYKHKSYPFPQFSYRGVKMDITDKPKKFLMCLPSYSAQSCGVEYNIVVPPQMQKYDGYKFWKGFELVMLPD